MMASGAVCRTPPFSQTGCAAISSSGRLIFQNPNAVMAMLWPHLPKTTGATEKVADIVNPGGFLPADRGYWTYTGSLSALPCTEGVRWIIYENDLTLSLEQLRTFMILYRMNSRPLQDPHGRRIEASE